MNIDVFSNNFLQTNTYFLIQDNDCFLIDPGSNSKQIIKIIEKNHLIIKGVILTHAHFDHFISCNEINQLFDVPLYIHKNGIEILYDPKKNVSAYVGQIPPLSLDKNIEVIEVNEETKQIGDFQLKIFHTPGHSPEGICLYFKDDKLLISGDTLFKLGIGRSDFYNGNEKQLITNIKNKLFKLPDDTIVYPGHGDKTTIGYEKKHNKYIR